MVRRRVALTAVLAALAVVVAGCSVPRTTWVDGPAKPSAGASPGASAANAIAWKDCADEVRDFLGLVPGGITYECGTVTVPQNWNTARDGKATDGKTIDLAVLRARARQQSARIGSLIINPGGPGGSGYEYAAYLAAIAPGAAQRFDIVGFDPRGVARSAPIKCYTDTDLDAVFGYEPDPVSQPDFDRYVALTRRMVAGCGTKYGETLPLYSTEQAARDIDAIRIALGDDKLNYLGFSYGTLLGATYAQLFPTKIRAMVLDGAVDPQQAAVASSEGQAKGFERAFDSFATWCRQNANRCPIGPDARAAVTAALAAARTGPVRDASGRAATAGWIFTAIVSSLYVQDYWPELASAIDNVRKGDPKGVFRLADAYADRDTNGSYSNLFDANNAVNCADGDQYPTVQAIRTVQADWRTKYPIFGAPLAIGMLSCSLWPGKRDPYPVGPAKGAPPILVVGTTGDPATPYEQTPKLAGMLGTGRVVTSRGEGHTAYPDASCVRRVVDRYLIDLVVPESDPNCPPE